MSRAAVEALRSTLDTRYRVTVPDGRTFVGLFTAIDPQGNLVLDGTVELAPETPGYAREVGLVLIAKRHWVTIEREELDIDRQRREGVAQDGGASCLPV